jgi:hypothetical protein
MAENKMAEVAKLFGKKLNEPFYLKDHKGWQRNDYIYE